VDYFELLQSKDSTKQKELVQGSTILHDICVNDVKYYQERDIDIEIPIPAQSGGSDGGCRGELIPLDPDVTCNVRVICAEESLKTNCRGVIVRVGFQVTLTPPNPNLCPVMVLNHYEDFEFTSFFPFPSGSPISGSALQEALKKIDGSCIVTEDLSCEILDGQCSRVHITGRLIDKLWKHENLWLLAYAPFGGITVGQEFPEPHKIGVCDPSCPDLRSVKIKTYD